MRVSERRTLATLLFCDVTGSTSLGEELDPEAVRDLMFRYFSQMRAAIERHGGTVEKFVGDAVMAVFGVPVAHEDDALRALRAATEMRERLETLNHELERSFNVRLALRIGVNTGDVVAGDAAAGELIVTGDAVNVAARLEQAADPGEIILGELAYRLARDAVEIEPIEPLVLKGKSEPVAAYRLLAVAPGTPAQARRLDAPLVGRSEELTVLRALFANAVNQNRCALTTVLGEAGVGKSRLAAEFLAELAGRALVVRGRCLAYGEGITFWPLVEIVRESAGIRDEDSGDKARDRIAAVLGGEPDGHGVAEQVSAAVGLGDATAGADELVWAVRRYLEVLARERPLVLLVEDIHWAEPAFLDLLETVSRRARAAIFILATTRPDVLEARPGWPVALPLEPLDRREGATLVESLLDAELPSTPGARIAEAAEGNPLFIEELLAMLIEDGLLIRENGTWTATRDLADVSIPTSIRALLAARLDRLEPEVRFVAERGSVEGIVFHRGAVAELSPEETRGEVPALLDELVGKDLILAAASSFVDEAAFRFRHGLIRDAAYEGTTKRTRADLHERFAGWLEWIAGERVVEYEEIVGYHLEQAFRYTAEFAPGGDVGGELAERAAARLGRAGRRALARGDAAASVKLLDRTLALIPAGDPGRPQLLAELGFALHVQGELVRAEAVLREATEAAAAAGQPAVETEALLDLVHLRSFTDPEGRMRELAAAAARAVGVFERTGHEAGLAKAWRMQGHAQFVHCRYGAAAQAFERALDHARQAANRREEGEAVFWLGAATWFGPMPAAEAIVRWEAERQSARGRPLVEAHALHSLGLQRAQSGDTEVGRRLNKQAREIWEELGYHFFSAGTQTAAGIIELLAENPAAAEVELRRGYEELEAMGEKAVLSTISALLAEAIYAQGRYEEAEPFTYISEAAAATDDLESQVRWRAVRAKLLARRGDIERGERLAREAVALAEPTESPNLKGDALVDLAEVLCSSGHTAEARPNLSRALALYQAKGNVVSARRTQAALAGLPVTA